MKVTFHLSFSRVSRDTSQYSLLFFATPNCVSYRYHLLGSREAQGLIRLNHESGGAAVWNAIVYVSNQEPFEKILNQQLHNESKVRGRNLQNTAQIRIVRCNHSLQQVSPALNKKKTMQGDTGNKQRNRTKIRILQSLKNKIHQIPK